VHFDAIVLGAGAAGMMCAAVAGAGSKRVLLIDHATKLAEKIRISGGGRCNFTNRCVNYEQFVSKNPRFARQALTSYTPRDFISAVNEAGIGWHEKHRGQLFCDESSEQIIQMLKRACDRSRVTWRMPCTVHALKTDTKGFHLETTTGSLTCEHLVIATGGTALPQVGATDFGLRIAAQLELPIVTPRAALVPLQFDPQVWEPFAALAGLSLPVDIGVESGSRQRFVEDILFTHRGLSGPGVLQISSYWQPGQSLDLNLAAGLGLTEELLTRKSGSRQQAIGVLAEFLPRRLAQSWLGESANNKFAEWSDNRIRKLSQSLEQWRIKPSGTAGLRKAEVMAGGVDTDALDPRSMMTRGVRGLYFIGEVVDVTGWLGGYNFQWAWASGVACGRAIASD
jgi:predicted Rossmann fold flavoprotein